MCVRESGGGEREREKMRERIMSFFIWNNSVVSTRTILWEGSFKEKVSYGERLKNFPCISWKIPMMTIIYQNKYGIYVSHWYYLPALPLDLNVFMVGTYWAFFSFLPYMVNGKTDHRFFLFLYPCHFCNEILQLLPLRSGEFVSFLKVDLDPTSVGQWNIRKSDTRSLTCAWALGLSLSCS